MKAKAKIEKRRSSKEQEKKGKNEEEMREEKNEENNEEEKEEKEVEEEVLTVSKSPSACEEQELLDFPSPETASQHTFYKILCQPHTITVLLITGGLLAWFAFTHDYGAIGNTKVGIASAAAVFLVFALCQFPDGMFRKPHPLVWRVVTGVGVLYLLFLVFMLFQNLDNARKLMAFIDPNLGKPLPERSYAVDCRIYTPENPNSHFANVVDAVKDEFFIAHFVGWFIKTLGMRDVVFAVVISGFFEVLELSLQHILPNFRECWWDHIILDMMLCNAAGMLLAKLVLKMLAMKSYTIAGIGPRTMKDQLRVVINQFTPESWTEFSWGMFTNWKRFLYVIVFFVLYEIEEVSIFFWKALLWIPPPHPLVIIRLLVFGAISFPGIREYYQFMIDPTCHVLGPNFWILAAVIVLEAMCSVKWSMGKPIPPTPPAVKWGWIIGVSFVVIFFFTYFPITSYLLNSCNKKKKNAQTPPLTPPLVEEDKKTNKNKKNKAKRI